jgi:peptidoglycan/LPS O-acetylase OafA/YrhL
MNKELSLYLDVCRFSAALVVFLSHFATRQLSGGALWRFNNFGEDAVAIFFVLSGLVIAYVTESREKTVSTYTVSRLARIYSVALPALLFTFAIDAIGQTFRPELYTIEYINYPAEHRGWQFIAGLFFLNELWNNHTIIGSNGPYWSLGFETWYYLVFGIAFYASPRWRIPLAALALLVAGPRIAVLFPLWLIGVGCYRFMNRHRFNPTLGWCAFIGAPIAFFALHYAIGSAVPGIFAPFEFTWLRFASALYFTALGLLFAIHLLGFNAVSSSFADFLRSHANRIRYVAGATFTLYLFHLPLMLFTAACAPWPVSAWQTRALVFAVPLVATFAIAEVTERRKDVWRKIFERAFHLRIRLAPRKAPVA